MDKRTIIFMYAKALIILIFIFWFIFIIFTGGRIIKWENAIIRKQEFVQKYEGIMNIIIKIVVGCIFIPSFIFTVVPAIMDIPYVIQNQYVTVSGIALNGYESNQSNARVSTKDRVQKRKIELQRNDTGEKINIYVYSRGIVKGEGLTINYLPNSGYGTLMRRAE